MQGSLLGPNGGNHPQRLPVCLVAVDQIVQVNPQRIVNRVRLLSRGGNGSVHLGEVVRGEGDHEHDSAQESRPFLFGAIILLEPPSL